MYRSRKRNRKDRKTNSGTQLHSMADAWASASHVDVKPIARIFCAVVCMCMVFTALLLTGCGSGAQTFGGETRETKTVDSVSDITKDDLNGIWEFKGLMLSSDYVESSNDSTDDDELEKLLMMPLFDGCYLTFDDKYNAHFDYMNSRTSGNYSLDGNRIIIATGDLLDNSKNGAGTALGAQAQFSDGSKSKLLVHNGDGVKYIMIFERFNGSETDKAKFNLFIAHEKQLDAVTESLDKNESLTDEEKAAYLESFKLAQKEDEKFFESDGVTPKSNVVETSQSESDDGAETDAQDDDTDSETDISRDLSSEMTTENAE